MAITDPYKTIFVCMTPPSSPSFAHHVHAALGYKSETIYGDMTMYVTGTVEYGRKIWELKSWNPEYTAGIGQKLGGQKFLAVYYNTVAHYYIWNSTNK